MSGTKQAHSDGYVLLEDGTRFDGVLCAAPVEVTGEVVFNTSITGYQEAVTDPSYAGQIITFTYPLIGNYGVSDRAMESDRVHARAVIMRDAKNHGMTEQSAAASPPDMPVSGHRPLTGARAAASPPDMPVSGHRPLAGAPGEGWLDWLAARGVPGITGVDTRALVRRIRDSGAMRGGIFAASTPESAARERVGAEQPMAGADLASTVTPQAAIELDGSGPHVVALDTGIKRSILHQLRERDCRLTLLPCTSSAADVLERDPDLVFLANGPGDPAALDGIVETVRGVIGERPVVGICLGHQLLCRAVGLETFKLPFGHRGANHPVKDLASGRIDITSQNHGFAVRPPDGTERIEGDEPVRWQTDFGAAELSHLNLYDRTVEGLVLRDVPGCTVQYHPEAGPGPHDARYLFDRFISLT